MSNRLLKREALPSKFLHLNIIGKERLVAENELKYLTLLGKINCGSDYAGLEINFFIHSPAGDKKEKFGHQFQKD